MVGPHLPGAESGGPKDKVSFSCVLDKGAGTGLRRSPEAKVAATNPTSYRLEGGLGMDLCQTAKEKAAGPPGLPSDFLGEEGPGEGLSPTTPSPSPAKNRAHSLWLGTAGYFKRTWGNSALPWRLGRCRLGRPQHICAQREACTGGLWGPLHHGGSVWEGTSAHNCPWTGQFYGPLPGSVREPTDPGNPGVPCQPVTIRTGERAKGARVGCCLFTSLVLDMYSL